MATLTLRLLGDIQITHGGEPINDFVTRKAQALLLYLATTQMPQSRDRVASLLWPEMAVQQARNNLRRILPNLRKLMGDHLTIDYQAVTFNRNAPYVLDIEVFTSTPPASSNGDLTTMDLALLEEKAKLYRGEFLEGFHIGDSPEFEEWMLLEREYFHQQAIRILTILADRYLQAGKTEAGLATTNHLLELEPWSEATHRLQMLLLAQGGQRTAALTQYEMFRKVLADEFGVEPSAEMTTHYTRIKAGALTVSSPDVTQQSVGNEHDPPPPPSTAASLASTPATPSLDCGDMPRPATFYGRQPDMTELTRWLLTEQKSVIGILGTGGAGKTAFVAQLVRALAKPTAHATVGGEASTSFAHIIWRSLVNAPSLATLVRSWLQILAGEQVDNLPATLYEQLELLFSYLRKQRCLLVLDNLESLLQEGENAGQFCEEHDEYEYLLQRMGETEHRSCLLFTSRELPMVIGRLERSYPMVSSYMLQGLDHESGVRLLRAEGLTGSAAELTKLVDRYSGIPLALKLVAETIQDFYGGEIAVLLQDRTIVFDDIQAVLNQQFDRLSPLERAILCWLAIEREPVSLQELAQNWVQPPPRRKFLEAARSLQRRGMLETAIAEPTGASQAEKHEIRFLLQNVVMEYVSEVLIEGMYTELLGTAPTVAHTTPLHSGQSWLNRYSLVKAQSQTHIRDAQMRLLLQPLARRLLNQSDVTYVARHLGQWLNTLRHEEAPVVGYAGTNILHLLIELKVDLNHWDFSHLSLRQADLRTEALAQVNLQGADLTDAAFLNTIDIICAVALSPDGRYLTAGGSDGAIYIWRTVDYQLHSVLERHTQAITSLVFSHDGAFLASSGLDGLVCIWEIESPALLRVLADIGKAIVALALHPDSRQLAAAVTDERIYVWDWQQPAVKQILPASTTISALSFHPNGQWLLCVGDQQKIYLWNLQRSEQVQTLQGHDGKILTVAFEPQGEGFATGGEDGQIWLWDMATMQPCRVFNGHKDFVLALAFRADGSQLVSSSADQTVRTWDVKTGEQQQVFRGHHGWVNTVTYFPDGRTVASGGYDQTIRIWQAQSGQLQRMLQGYLSQVDFTTFSEDGALLAACGLDGTIRIWQVASATLWHTLRGPQAATRHLAFSHNHEALVTVGDDYVVRLWDVPRGRLQYAWHGHTAPVRTVAFTPDERYVISGSHDQTLHIWEVATGQLQRVIPNVCATIQFAIALSPTQHYLAYGTLDNTITVVDLHSDAVLHTIDIAPTTAIVLTFDRGGQQLACGARDGQVLVYAWDSAAAAYTLRYQVQATESPVWRLLFSPDGKTLAWICAGQEIHLLDLATGQVSAAIRTYYGSSCLSFDSDSQTLFTDGADYTVLMRNARTGEITQALNGHTAGITSITHSPAGDKVASCSFDGSICVWDAKSGACLAVMRAPGPYAGMNIADVTGISGAQRQALMALGAVEGRSHS
ncbi:MAG: BTAD domain-containing putative transcriptional regulator [Caldilineaceae bacterium]